MCDTERLITVDDRRSLYETKPNQECFSISNKSLVLVMSETDLEQGCNSKGNSAKSVESIEDYASIGQSVISDDIEFLLTMKFVSDDAKNSSDEDSSKSWIMFQCHLCSKSFRDSETMKNHWKEAHGLETEKIELPSYESISKADLQIICVCKTVLTVESETSLESDLELQIHRYMECGFVGVSTQERDVLLGQQFEDSGSSQSNDQKNDRFFHCKECPYKAKQRRVLKRHLKGHMEETPFKCKKCKFFAGSYAGLLCHTKIHPKVKECSFQCEICSYALFNPTSSLGKMHLTNPEKANLFPSFCANYK